MGTKITMNAVLECRNQVAAKRILMEAMNGRLYSYLEPLPSGLADDETEEWRWKNWGCSMEPFFDAGWIMNKSVLLKIHGGSPDQLNEILKSHAEVDSFTLSYSGFEDEFSKPDFCGIWMDDRLTYEKAPDRYVCDHPF